MLKRIVVFALIVAVTACENSKMTGATASNGLRSAGSGARGIGEVGKDIDGAWQCAKQGNVSCAFDRLSRAPRRVDGVAKNVGDLATIVGPLAGVLNEKEQQAVVNKQGQTLSSAKDGKQIVWVGSQTGAEVRMTPTDTRTETREMVVLRESEVEEADDLEIIGDTYVVSSPKGATLRVGPSSASRVVRTLNKGQAFTGVGKAPGRDQSGDYILLAEESRWIGYVPAMTVKASGNDDLLRTANLGDAVPANTVVERVSVTTTCRTLKSEARTTSGETAEDAVRACRAPDGAWEIQ